MDGLAFVASLVASLAWPLVAAFVIYLFREPIAARIRHVRSLDGLGAEGAFDPGEAGQIVVDATTTSAQAAAEIAQSESVTPQRTRSQQLRDLAAISPRAAVSEAFHDVDEALARRTSGVELPTAMQGRPPSPRGLTDLARQSGLITYETGQAILSLLEQRNRASHGGDVDSSQALDFIALAQNVIYAIEAVPASLAGTGVTGGTGDGPRAAAKRANLGTESRDTLARR